MCGRRCSLAHTGVKCNLMDVSPVYMDDDDDDERSAKANIDSFFFIVDVIAGYFFT